MAPNITVAERGFGDCNCEKSVLCGSNVEGITANISGARDGSHGSIYILDEDFPNLNCGESAGCSYPGGGPIYYQHSYGFLDGLYSFSQSSGVEEIEFSTTQQFYSSIEPFTGCSGGVSIVSVAVSVTCFFDSNNQYVLRGTCAATRAGAGNFILRHPGLWIGEITQNEIFGPGTYNISTTPIEQVVAVYYGDAYVWGAPTVFCDGVTEHYTQAPSCPITVVLGEQV